MSCGLSEFDISAIVVYSCSCDIVVVWAWAFTFCEKKRVDGPSREKDTRIIRDPILIIE